MDCKLICTKTLELLGMHLHRKINAARRNAVSRRAWRCVKLFEHDQWHRTVRGHWFKGGTAVQCATFAACRSFHEHGKNSLRFHMDTPCHGCRHMYIHSMQLCHPLRETFGSYNVSHKPACSSKLWFNEIQRNAKWHWGGNIVKLCLVFSALILFLLQLRKRWETGCAHDLSRFGEVEQSCIQIIRRRIHRHRLCLGTDEFQ